MMWTRLERRWRSDGTRTTRSTQHSRRNGRMRGIVISEDVKETHGMAREEGTIISAILVQQTEESFLAAGASGSWELKRKRVGILLIALSFARRSNSKSFLVIAAMPLSIVSPWSYPLEIIR